MSNYCLSKVNKYKKLLIAQENYWDDELSVEFCIARRTRDILLGRSIANNLAQGRRNANSGLVFNSEVEALTQGYFSSYVKNEHQISDFWGIFIKPSEEFVSRYTDFDAIWWPKVFASREKGEADDKLKASFFELVDLFREYRNKDYWENDDEWEWFFYQYLVFLADNLPEQACRDGLAIFISLIVKMHRIVESSGWKVDYGLYDEPLKVWGGQSLISKLWVRKQTADFTREAMKKLGRQQTANRRNVKPNNILNFTFTYFFVVFGLTSLLLAGFVFVDALISSVFFIIYGYWASVLQNWLTSGLNILTWLEPNIWKINTGLLGLDYLANKFISLQYKPLGRWIMLGISLLVSTIFLVLGYLFGFEFRDKSSNPNTPTDISFALLISLFTYLAILSPCIFGVCVGILFDVIDAIKYFS